MLTGFVKRRADGSTTWIYSKKSKVRSARVRDVRWGDYLRLDEVDDAGWAKIKWGSKTYFIDSDDVATTRPLEVIFLDVGQGDGCIVVSPEARTDANAAPHERERIMIIDAGIDDNMYRFIAWRFGKLKKTFRFHAAVITHPDSDHYRGFRRLFKHENVEFDRVYHNGIAERNSNDVLGPSDPSDKYLSDIMVTDADIRALYSNPAVRGSKWYPTLIFSAMQSNRVDKIEMLSTRHGEAAAGRTWMPGFSPVSGRSTAIEVLGPLVETVNGKPALRWFGDVIGSNAHAEDKTKNGHSILLRLSIGQFKLVFGGDLNAPAEDFLLRHYGEIDASQPLSAAVPQAASRLSADMMKSCHHGSSDVTDEFSDSVHPFAFVVSSGDEESHAHPRPDLLGRLGKRGRSDAPLILCTELLRSTREKGREEDFKKLGALNDILESSGSDDAAKAEARKQRTKLLDFIKKRNVGVYGSITARTDGTHLEISFRLEAPRGKQLWQRYVYVQDSHDQWTAVGGADH